MGFERKGTIVFDHRENKQENRLPSVSTCLPQLQLPVCNCLTEDYHVFKEQMNLAVLGSVIVYHDGYVRLNNGNWEHITKSLFKIN